MKEGFEVKALGESIPIALTIAGSDSGGGAGIQADLKTFAALGVHGISAVTSITAQNTNRVTEVFDIPGSTIKSQIETVRSDIGFHAVKIGMLHNTEIVNAVADYFEGRPFSNIVVDPVMVSKSGSRLLKYEAVTTLVQRILPLSFVLTPNIDEASVLLQTKSKISNIDAALRAAKEISELGPKIVIVKGGHLRPHRNGKNDTLESIDTVYFKKEKKIEYLRSIRYPTKNTHGTGCVFSSAIAAELAKGKKVIEAIRSAKIFVSNAIKNSLAIGSGAGPVNPSGEVLVQADRYLIYSNIKVAVNILETNGSLVSKLIPESRSNIGMAIESAKSYQDVIAVSGRITSLVDGRAKASGEPEFGASRHISNAILAAMKYDKDVRSAMNIAYSPETIESCRRLGLTVSSYDRRKEPSNIKRREGSSTFWGAEQAILKSKKFPDIFFHIGDFGKEPMIVILGHDAISVAGTAVKIAKSLESNSRKQFMRL